jgi:hypothetical protein
MPLRLFTSFPGAGMRWLLPFYLMDALFTASSGERLSSTRRGRRELTIIQVSFAFSCSLVSASPSHSKSMTHMLGTGESDRCRVEVQGLASCPAPRARATQVLFLHAVASPEPMDAGAFASIAGVSFMLMLPGVDEFRG